MLRTTTLSKTALKFPKTKTNEVALSKYTALKYFKYNHGHNTLRLFATSPQVKQSVVTSNKYGIYELPNELLNDLTLRILGS